MANRRFFQFFNTLHQKPVLLDCNFTVTPTDGAGVTNLVGPGIQNVWMHTSTTPTTGNPNPAAGYAVIKLQDTYNKFYLAGYSLQSPLTGAEISISGSSVLTVGVPYVITTVGTSTAANWQAVGLPQGITPAVGVCFIATATGSATGTGKVKINATGGAGVSTMDILGDPNTTIVSSTTNTNVGGVALGSYVVVRFLASAFTGTALGTHAHDLLIKGGQAASTTNDIAYYATDILGKEQATDATIAGSASATKGGVIAVSAGTPAGTMSYAVTAPATGSVIRLSLYLSNSSLLNKGE